MKYTEPTVELTSDHGWVPGTRPFRLGERVLVLLHQPDRVSIAVYTGTNPYIAFDIHDALVTALKKGK